MYAIIQTTTGRERLVRSLVERFYLVENERAFLPFCEREKKYQGKMRKVRTPLFPGYVFFSTADPVGLFFRLKQVPELTKLLRVDETILQLTDEESDLLLRLCGESDVLAMSRGIIEGEHVRILEGPLVGFEGNLSRINMHKRIATLTVPMLGREMSVTVGLEIIKKV